MILNTSSTLRAGLSPDSIPQRESGEGTRAYLPRKSPFRQQRVGTRPSASVHQSGSKSSPEISKRVFTVAISEGGTLDRTLASIGHLPCFSAAARCWPDQRH